MEFKGTQGEWSFYALDGGAFDIQVEGAGQYGGVLVLASRNSHSGRANEMHANGKLMTAAPELLGALKIMHQHVLELCLTHGMPLPEASIEKSSAAIRKATE